MVERIQGLCNAFYLTISGTSHCRCRCHYYCCSCYGLSSKSRRLRRFVKHRHRRRRSSRDGWKIEGILARTPADDSEHHRTRTRIRPLPYCCCSLTASAIFIPEVSCSPPPPTRPVLPAPHLRYPPATRPLPTTLSKHLSSPLAAHPIPRPAHPSSPRASSSLCAHSRRQTPGWNLNNQISNKKVASSQRDPPSDVRRSTFYHGGVGALVLASDTLVGYPSIQLIARQPTTPFQSATWW